MLALRWRRLQWHRYARTKAHVGPSAIVVVDPQLKTASEMPLTQRDQEVQTLSTHGAHKALTYGVCFWRPHGCSQNPDAHVRHGLVQFLREDAVPIVDHEPVRMVARQGFTELLEGPLGCRMRGDVVMKDLSRPSSMITNT
jgi:hypothetical protein